MKWLNLVILFFVADVWAGGLTAPFQFDSAAVLPKGIRNVRLQGATTEVSDKYVEGGSLQPLAYRMNRTLTYRDLVEAQSSVMDQASLTALVESEGRSLDSPVGESAGVANARVTTTVPVAAIGISEKWTLAAVIPIVYTNVNIDTGWTSNADFNSLYNGLAAQGRDYQREAFRSRLENVIQTKAAANGYDEVGGYVSTQLADSIIASKYQMYNTDQFAVVLTNKITIPTGRQQNINRLVDIPTGDGQWDLNAGVVGELYARPDLTLGSAAFYTHQLPTTKAKRIPVKPYEGMTPDIDPDTYEKQGDMMGASVFAKWKYSETLTIAGQFTYQYRQADNYSGSRYSAERYEWLALETEQQMNSGLVGVAYSTVPLFKKKQFPIPMEATVGWTRVFSGQNVSNIDLLSTEVAVYF